MISGSRPLFTPTLEQMSRHPGNERVERPCKSTSAGKPTKAGVPRVCLLRSRDATSRAGTGRPRKKRKKKIVVRARRPFRLQNMVWWCAVEREPTRGSSPGQSSEFSVHSIPLRSARAEPALLPSRCLCSSWPFVATHACGTPRTRSLPFFLSSIIPFPSCLCPRTNPDSTHP